LFLKKLLSHSLIYALGPQIPKIASLFVLPIITRYLTAADYGIYGVILSYTSLLGAFSDLGFSVVMVNAYYNYPSRWRIIWRQLHFYLIVWSVIYAILLALLLILVMPEQVGDNKLNIIGLVCLPAMFFSAVPMIGGRYYQFAQKPMYVAGVSAIIGAIAIILNLYTIAYLKMGYMGWFVSNAISAVLIFLCYAYPVFIKYKLHPVFIFRKSFLIKNLKVSLPIIPHSYSSYLLNASDRLIMDRVRIKVNLIGEYNLAYTFGGYFEFFGNALGMAVGPFYTKLYSQKSVDSDRSVHFITHWLQISFIGVGFIASLWCKELLELLVKNDELKMVYPFAIIIIMGYSYRPYYWSAVNRLQYVEKTNQLWRISLLAGLLNLVLNLIFIPIFGIMAACVTTFLSLMYLGFSGYFLKAFKANETMKYKPLLWGSIIILTTVLVYYLKDIPVYLKLIMSALSALFYSLYIVKNKNRFLEIKV